MIQRALNCVDSRLVDHGLRVGAIMDAMLEAAGWEPARRRDACLMALMHDIGAYRTEEIDRLVEFESCDVWEHSFYGYLFFKELSPLAGYAEVVLYHHMPDRLFTDQDPAVRFLAQVLQVADRVDMLLLERPGQAPRRWRMRWGALLRASSRSRRRPCSRKRSGAQACSGSCAAVSMRGMRCARCRLRPIPMPLRPSSTCSCMSSTFAAATPSPIR
ncbi:MAG: HD domain-containing protein [Gordonibacter pamelaeae]